MKIIVTHLASDFDSFAGMVAAKKLFPDAEIILPSSLNQNVREFMLLYEDELPHFKEISEVDLNKVNTVIIIDTRIISRLGNIQSIFQNPDLQIITIDHHQRSKEDVKTNIEYYKKVGSSTTIVVNEIIKKKLNFSPLEATLFLLGIYEDTGSFSYPNTSYFDFKISSFLLKHGANLFTISKFLNLSLTEEQHKLLEKLILNSKKIKINEKEILFSSEITNNYVEGLSVLTRKLSQIEDINVVFCWVKMKDKIYIVGRSDDNDVDVSKILSTFGGGGHQFASSAIVKDLSFEKIKEMLISSLKKNIKKPLVAKNIMTSPVKVVNENETINNVSNLLKKYGHSGIPIVNSEGLISGIITRKDIDKAIKHGLSHAPVKGFKSGEIIYANPETPIEEIQKLMVENAVGRIPIISKNKIVGIITRKDLLRYLNYKNNISFLENSIINEDNNYFNIDICKRLKLLFPENIINIFEIISNLAKEFKYKAYLVGGIVRDILLNKPNLDIDIVVEGDGIKFASKLANILNAKIWTYKKFKTSVVVLENNQHIDVATARIEYYDKPAALPNVEQASIRQDLYRRDFTINSMAISLNKENFGTLIDYFGGRRDLKRKKIKVMHKLSMIEDPTRIFRAVRFEQRFAFKIDKQTESLIKSAIEMGIISQLTGVRIRDELISILDEDKPWKPLKRLYEYKALQKININVVVDKEFEKKLKKILKDYEELKKFYGESLKKWRLIFAILLSDKEYEEAIQWCKDMKVKNKDIDVIINTIIMKDEILKKIDNANLKNSDLYFLLKNSPPELQTLLCSLGGEVKRNIIYYIKNLKNTHLFINGKDIIRLGITNGPEIGKILNDLLILKLNGQIKDKEDEYNYVKNIIKKL